MRVYISIPITDKDEQKQREHADLTKAMLSRVGHTPISPFDIYAGKNPKYEDYLCYDLRALADCDAIYLCEGWQFSRGCRIEVISPRSLVNSLCTSGNLKSRRNISLRDD